MLESVVWKIGGEAGFGIMSSGTMLAKTFSRAGYHVLATNDYPSLIRGGHNLITLRIATTAFESMNRDVHILVALNKRTIDIHKDELSEGAVVIFDPKDYEWQDADFPKKAVGISVPLSEIVSQKKVDPVMRNTIALGASIAVLGTDFALLEAVIRDQFKKKKQEIIDGNIELARAGYDHVKTNNGSVSSMYIGKSKGNERYSILNASEAFGFAAVRAGVKFAAIYPMTPINAVISFLADHAKEFGIVYKQPEDEIAGINMAVGASFGGVRSMVATSGGGFCLMVEGVSMAGIMELPIVVDLGMRVGPATGMPTYTEQSELQFAIHAGHGEFPKIVLAPGDAKEVYQLVIDAFNLADRFQTPVIVLTDKHLNESQWCVPESLFRGEVHIDRGKLITSENDLPKDGSYLRYSLNTEDGVSPRAMPGMKGGHFYANSYEHDEKGHMTERADGRQHMADKRAKKVASILKEAKMPTVYGDDDADITFISWGSTKGPVLDAMQLLAQKGKKTKLIQFFWMYPLDDKALEEMLRKEKRLVDVEQNGTGQLASLIREHTGIYIEERILKNDGRPFFPEEIAERVKL